MEWIRYALVTMFLVAAAYQLVAIYAVVQFIRRRKPDKPDFLPPVSVLKPVHGLDPDFYESIRSHALQDFPEFEILFGVSDPGDPVVPEIQRLQSEFPRLRIELIHCPESLPNPKVAKLVTLVQHARHPLLLVNDGDIRVEPDYLTSVASSILDPQVGLVTCLYRVAAEELPAKFEALGVSTDFATSVLVAPLAGVRVFGLGSTLLFRASDLQQMGGYGSIAHYLADDFQLAKGIAGQGKTVLLSRTVVQTASAEDSWSRAWSHQVRWQRTIFVSRLDGYLGLPVTFATFWAVVALAIGEPSYAMTLLGLRMASGMLTGIGALECPVARRFWPWIPVRDLLGNVIWLSAMFSRTILWRGTKLRLSRDGRILPESADAREQRTQGSEIR